MADTVHLNLSTPQPTAGSSVGAASAGYFQSFVSDGDRLLIDTSTAAQAVLYVSGTFALGDLTIEISSDGTNFRPSVPFSDFQGTDILGSLDSATPLPDILTVVTIGIVLLRITAENSFSGPIAIRASLVANHSVVAIRGKSVPLTQLGGVGDGEPNQPILPGMGSQTSASDIRVISYPLVYNGGGTQGWERPRTQKVAIPIDSVALDPGGTVIWSPGFRHPSESWPITFISRSPDL